MQQQFAGLKIWLFASCLLILSATVSADTPETVVKDWTLTDATGTTVNYYSDSRGSVSVILFWATWCPFCRTLMPHLQIIADEFEASKVKFYALNVWEDGDPQKYFRENGYTFRLLLMGDLVAEDYGVPGTPGLFVLDKNHRIVYLRRSGENDDDVEVAVREAIRLALATDQK